MKACEKITNETSARLILVTEKEHSAQPKPNRKLAKVAVTVGGTWQKRGYSCKNGAVCIISVRHI